MGLDGISVNQLRITPENNSSEMNNQVKFSLNGDMRVVDGLAEGQKVDPDKEREKDKRSLQKGFSSDGNQEEDNVEADDFIEPTEKYDLSQTDKYVLKLDEATNNILIIEKATKKIIQKIDANELSQFVNYMSGPTGSIINRKF